jgi:hypothetical protein
MIRTRALLTISLAVFSAALLAGCDVFGEGVDPQKIIDETFANETKVTSGVIDVNIEGSAEGTTGGSFSASVSGPFQGSEDDKDALPQLDLTADANATAVGQSFDFGGGLTITEDNAFIAYQGDTYELGSDTFSQLRQGIEAAAEQAGVQQDEESSLAPGAAIRQSCEQAVEQAGGDDTSACDIDFGAWLTNLSDEGTEDIGGVSTTHVSGDIDVQRIVEDLIAVAEAAGGAAAGAIPSEDQIRQVTDAVEEAGFDLYSGEDDRILRGLDFSFAIDPTAIPGAETAGVERVSLTFTLRLTGVNEEQTVNAPSGAKPLSDLLGSDFDLGNLQDLGNLGALGGVGGAGGTGGVPETESVPPADSDTAQAYLDCVAENPNDIDQCQALLTP